MSGDPMSAAEKIALGDHDNELDAILNAVTDRKRYLAPWDALAEMARFHLEIQEKKTMPQATRLQFGVQVHHVLKKELLTHPSEIVKTAAKLLQREVFIECLGVLPSQVDSIEKAVAPSE